MSILLSQPADDHKVEMEDWQIQRAAVLESQDGYRSGALESCARITEKASKAGYQDAGG